MAPSSTDNDNNEKEETMEVETDMIAQKEEEEEEQQEDEIEKEACDPVTTTATTGDSATDTATATTTSNISDLVPGITNGDMEIAIRVLNAVAQTMNPKTKGGKQKQNNKKRKHNDDDTVDDDDNNGRSSSLDIYKNSKILRPFRKALSNCMMLHQCTMYNGVDELRHYQSRIRNRSLKRQKQSERHMQKKYIASTQLRKGRMDKLNEKITSQYGLDEEQAKIVQASQIMLIPDGPVVHVNEEGKNGQKLLLENGGGENGGSNDGRQRPAQQDPGSTTTTNISTNDQDKQTEGEDQKSMAAAATTTTTNTNVVVETVVDEDGNDNSNNNPDTNNIQLPKLRSCYVCKLRYRELHHFYDQLCPTCAELNWTKRHQTSDLRGKIAVVTGSRVKIGYQTCLKLLRCGATVIATTRFPNTAAQTYRNEPDFHTWKDNLQIYGLDLRDVTGIELFVRYLKQILGDGKGLDILINNACQTIRRPRAYYLPLTQQEQTIWTSCDDVHKSLLLGCIEYETIRRKQQSVALLEHQQEADSRNGDNNSSPMPLLMNANPGGGDDHHGDEDVSDKKPAPTNAAMVTSSSSSAASSFETTGISYSTAMSQMIVLPEDVGVNDNIIPPGVTDVQGQQLDLRTQNSWLLKLENVSTPELMECMFINAIAPFVLNSRLKSLMMIPSDTDTFQRDDRYIINVSAMEGKFYRYKMPNHRKYNNICVHVCVCLCVCVCVHEKPSVSCLLYLGIFDSFLTFCLFLLFYVNNK